MSSTITGFVEKVFENERTGRTGPYTLYSFKVQDKDTGVVNPLYFNCGYNNPGVKEGDYVRFAAVPSTHSDKGMDVAKGSVKVSTKPPERPDNPAPKAAYGGKKGGGGYQKDPKIQKAISYQSARKDALVLVQLLLENDGLPILGTTGKAAKAKRYEEIVAYVDKLTVRLYNDTDTLRLLESIDDDGIAPTPDTGDAAEEIDETVVARETEQQDDEGFEDEGF